MYTHKGRSIGSGGRIRQWQGLGRHGHRVGIDLVDDPYKTLAFLALPLCVQELRELERKLEDQLALLEAARLQQWAA